MAPLRSKEVGILSEIRSPDPVIPLLSVSPSQPDHAALRELLDGTRWDIRESGSVASALKVLRQEQIPLIVCERDLQPGTWKDVLKRITALSNPPYLIVTSVQADEELWMSALNAGAYDVLVKPFDAGELTRTLFQAWLHWQGEFRTVTPAGHPKALNASVQDLQ